ncbi:unnamed protein product [Penicillium camemberti]|uniref:Str. FM013 n=1 Tax=Penicillium camemberti (strain FM 013) TaxID=1429867 RepID=A0A0G4P0N8_PENC3|nr:unnamed protein product [Penicillium camemberti]
MAHIHPLKWKKPSTSTNSDSSKDSDSAQAEVSFPSSSNQMRHPWGVFDYHMYLSHIESKRDELRRKKECHLLGATGFRQVTLHDEPELDDIRANTNPKVVFVSLPVPDMQDEFSNARLVLGFDLKSDRLQGYFFESEVPIENYEDLWQVWNQGGGELVIDVPVQRFLSVIRHTMQEQIEILEIGVLHHYGLTTRVFQAGLDMVIAVQFLQFVDDFAELLTEETYELRGLYLPFQDELRNLLEGGSRDAWFAVRDGLDIQQYRQKQLKKVVASGLFHGQNAVVLREGPEKTPQKEKTSRPVKIMPCHSSPWSWSKLQMQVLAEVERGYKEESDKPTLIEAKSAPPPSLAQSGIARNNLCGATWLDGIVAAIIFSPIGQVITGKSWQRQSCSFESCNLLYCQGSGPKGTDPQLLISLRFLFTLSAL